MIPYQEFITARKSIHSRNWTIQPWWLFSWGLKQLGLLDLSIGVGLLPTASFVILPNVEEAASKIVNKMGSSSNQIDRIYPMSMFSTEAGKVLKSQNGLTESDLHLILTYLARDKSRIIYDAETVKFKAAGETSSTLTTQDKTIASLKTLIADINLQVAMFSTRISHLSESARKAINNKNRTSALAALRSKKLSETILMQRSETLAQLEEVYGKIEQAADQIAIVRVMEASTGVLRNLHAKIGGIDKVEDVIEGLRDEMGKVDEVGGVIEASAQVDSVIDESAVDEELESLERQAKAREEEKGARQTQERLASIATVRKTEDNQPEERKDNPQEPSSDRRAPDPPMEEGISGLKRLSLDDPRGTPEKA